MRFTIDMLWSAVFVSPRSRNPSMKTFVEAVTIEAPVANDAMAPVATRWNNGETRWFAGRHYSRYTDTDARENEPRFEQRRAGDANTVIAAAIDGDPGKVFKGYFSVRTDDTNTRFDPSRHILTDAREDDMPAGSVNAAQRQESLDLVARWERDALVVDGALYIACAEPHYLLHRGDAVEVSIERPTYEADHWRRAVHERAIQRHYASSVHRADDLQLDGDIRFIDGRIEILIPESIALFPEKGALWYESAFLMDSYSDVSARETHPDIIGALHAIAITRWEQTIETVDFDQLADDMAGLLDSIERNERNRSRNTGNLVLNYRRAVERWNNRPVEALASFEP
jgi:hypothetical protein